MWWHKHLENLVEDVGSIDGHGSVGFGLGLREC